MKTISRYRILEPLGTCEMGTLVRAYDRWVVSTTRLVERRVRPPFGQSVLGVAAVS